jgi:hypothetical protein
LNYGVLVETVMVPALTEDANIMLVQAADIITLR